MTTLELTIQLMRSNIGRDVSASMVARELGVTQRHAQRLIKRAELSGKVKIVRSAGRANRVITEIP